MPSDNIAETVIGMVDNVVVGFVNQTFTSLWGGLETTFNLAIVLMVIIYGLMLLRGVGDFMDIVFKVFKIGLVLLLASNWGFYNTIVVETVTRSPDYIGSLVSGSDIDTASGAIGAIYIKCVDAMNQAFSQSGMFMPYVLGIAIFIPTTFVVVYSIFLIVLSKVLLAILLGLGPLFLLCLIFKATERMLETWAHQIINYMLINVLTITVLTLLSFLADSAINSIPDEGITLGSIMPTVVVFFTIFLVLGQVKTMASGIAGGMAINTYNTGHNATSAGKNALARAASNANAAGGKAIAAARARVSRGTLSQR